MISNSLDALRIPVAPSQLTHRCQLLLCIARRNTLTAADIAVIAGEQHEAQLT